MPGAIVLDESLELHRAEPTEMGGPGAGSSAPAWRHATILVRYGYGPSLGPRVLWGTGALVGGPVFGCAGRWWRAGSHRQRALALGLLVAVFVAEGIYNAVILSNPAVGAGFAIVGLLVPLALGRSGEDRIGAYVAAIPALCLGGAIGYLTFAWLSGWTSGV